MSSSPVRSNADNLRDHRVGTRANVLCGLFCALMIVGANLRIPFPVVPLTFQPFFAILSGLLLGARLGVLAQCAYVLIGLAGMPVFAGGSAGLTYVLKPTFGFLLGFILAAMLSGLIIGKEERPGLVRIGLASAAGLAAIYLAGIMYMFFIQSFYLAQSVTLFAVAQGMVPFLLKDLVLFIAASVLSLRLLPLLRKG